MSSGAGGSSGSTAPAAPTGVPGSGPTVKVEKIPGETGEVPPPRFGHTATHVGDNKIILFGGATGECGRYTIT